MLSLFILVPLFLLFVLNLPFKPVNKACFWLAGALLSAQILMALGHTLCPWSLYPDKLGLFFVFNLVMDNLTLVMLLVIGIVSLVALFVGKSTIILEEQRSNFVSLILACVIGMNAVVLVRDIFLYIFLSKSLPFLRLSLLPCKRISRRSKGPSSILFCRLWLPY